MGWGRALLLGDIGNRLDIADCENELENLRAGLQQSLQEKDDLENAIRILQKENSELKLYLTGLIRLMVSKNIITNQEIRQIVNIIDREDGRADGKADGSILGLK